MIALLFMAALIAAEGPTHPQPDVSRPVAGIVSPIWSDPKHRDDGHEVDQIVTRLGLRAGMQVADVGAGNGYDTIRLAKVVGPSGRVLAEDVTLSYLRELRRSVSAAGLRNVDIVQGDAGDPKLPARSIDAAIMVHMYHEVQQPIALLDKLAPAFKAGGRLGVEELDRPTEQHGTPPKLLTCELAAAGYHLMSMKPLSGDLGYFAVFSPPASGRPKAAEEAKACRD